MKTTEEVRASLANSASILPCPQLPIAGCLCNEILGKDFTFAICAYFYDNVACKITAAPCNDKLVENNCISSLCLKLECTSGFKV